MATPLLFKFWRNCLLWNVLHAAVAAAAQFFHKAGADLANVVAGCGKGCIGWEKSTLQRSRVERNQTLCHGPDDVAVLGHATPRCGAAIRGLKGFCRAIGKTDRTGAGTLVMC